MRYVPLHSRDFSFDTIVKAAYWLAGEMGVSTTLWARACQVMGRETAAVTLAIVSTRPAGHFTGGPWRLLCRYAAEIRERRIAP